MKPVIKTNDGGLVTLIYNPDDFNAVLMDDNFGRKVRLGYSEKYLATSLGQIQNLMKKHFEGEYKIEFSDVKNARGMRDILISGVLKNHMFLKGMKGTREDGVKVTVTDVSGGHVTVVSEHGMSYSFSSRQFDLDMVVGEHGIKYNFL